VSLRGPGCGALLGAVASAAAPLPAAPTTSRAHALPLALGCLLLRKASEPPLHCPLASLYCRNLAVGGLWPGAPDDSTPFPATYTVDYVRVWGTPS
jgi:hypothetical protein